MNGTNNGREFYVDEFPVNAFCAEGGWGGGRGGRVSLQCCEGRALFYHHSVRSILLAQVMLSVYVNYPVICLLSEWESGSKHAKNCFLL